MYNRPQAGPLTPGTSNARWIRPSWRASAIACAGILLVASALAYPAVSARAYEEHTVTLYASHLVWSFTRSYRDGWARNCDEFHASAFHNRPSPGTVWAGYYHYSSDQEGINCEKNAFTFQGRVTFDPSEIRQYPGPVVTRADLYFDELVLHAREGLDWSDGVWYPPRETCVYFINMAIGTGYAMEGGYPHREGSLTRAEIGHWNVTTAVFQWLVFPDENFGLVLRGGDEYLTDDSSACLSSLANFRIDVAFVSESPPTPTPTRTPNPFERLGPLDAPAPIAASHRPDLVVTNAYTKARGPGQPFGCDPGSNAFVAVIKNQGPLDAGPFSIDLLIQGSANPSFLTRAVPGLASGQEMAVEFPTTTLGPGAQLVRVTVDSTNAIDELDESKNYLEERCTV